MKKTPKPPAVEKLSPGPYATHFQEYAHDKFFRGARPEQETFTQKPRVSLGDFWENRLKAAVKGVDKGDED